MATDSAGFLRWQCPTCGLDFKLKCAETEKLDALAWWLQQSISEAIGAQSSFAIEEDRQSDETSICCPYCAKIAEKQQFTHPDVISYIWRIARREIVEPAISSIFHGFASGLKSTKFVKITMSEATTRSPRPISGPEPDDQVSVICLQCKEQFKVDDNWRGTVRCPMCRTELWAQ